ncbi:MAG: hydroxymethylglutaryl-CoA reductase, degradative [Candidatus Ranarchaeia archaeon]|jgi:hydroxymethylglutaryl-CoA reductase
MKQTSAVSGFYKISLEERIDFVAQFANLNSKDCQILKETGGLTLEQADQMVENAIGMIQTPLGIAVNFLINEKDYLVPMAIEEPSVIAAASNAAKIARVKGGFKASSTESLMIGQIQILDVKDFELVKSKILENKDRILTLANEQDPVLVSLGGGAKDLKVHLVPSQVGQMVVVHLLVDAKDAMGANAVNTMVEALTPLMEDITQGRVLLRILSNLAVHRLARAQAVFSKEKLGEGVVTRIIEAGAFAEADPFRATTHNKGVMNGISALMLATGNDTRAIEAGAHAYAAIKGKYGSLTHWEKTLEGDLKGTIELPMAVGIIGGATKINPVAKLSLKILGIKTARELAEVAAALGLAQNFAAIRALATEGIQKGHMALHARNIAVMAGAKGNEVAQVVQALIKEGKIRQTRAEEILKEMRREGK